MTVCHRSGLRVVTRRPRAHPLRRGQGRHRPAHPGRRRPGRAVRDPGQLHRPGDHPDRTQPPADPGRPAGRLGRVPPAETARHPRRRRGRRRLPGLRRRRVDHRRGPRHRRRHRHDLTRPRSWRLNTHPRHGHTPCATAASGTAAPFLAHTASGALPATPNGMICTRLTSTDSSREPAPSRQGECG